MFGIGLVGDEALEAVAVEVGERQLRAGVRTLNGGRSAALRPAGKVHLAGQLRHPRPRARLAVLLDRGLPRRLLKAEQHLA